MHYLNDYSYEFIFFKKTKKICLLEDEFTELDTMGNENLERLVLINYPFNDLNINGNYYNLHKNCPEKIFNSYQITEIDLEENLFIVKPIEEKDEFDSKFFEDNEELLNNFESELELLFEPQIMNMIII